MLSKYKGLPGHTTAGVLGNTGISHLHRLLNKMECEFHFTQHFNMYA
jgi:hypothetical protein